MTEFGPELHDLPAPLRLMVEGELRDDERVLWLGTPDPGRSARRSLPIMVFGIFWTSFAVFWTASAAGWTFPSFNSGQSLFPLFGVPFILIGVGMLSAPLLSRRGARRTAYILTDRRAIFINGGLRSTAVQSLAPLELGNLRRIQRRDGSGDLMFERPRLSGDGHDRSGAVIGFIAIPDVKAVEELVQDLLQAHRIDPLLEESA